MAEERNPKIVGNMAEFDPNTGNTELLFIVVGLGEEGAMSIPATLTPQGRRSFIEGLLDHHELWEQTSDQEEDDDADRE